MDGLQGLKEKFSFITDVRGCGLLIAVEFNSAIAQAVVMSCLDRGLLVNQLKPNAIRLVPPLIIGHSEVDRALGVLNKTLSSIVR